MEGISGQSTVANFYQEDRHLFTIGELQNILKQTINPLEKIQTTFEATTLTVKSIHPSIVKIFERIIVPTGFPLLNELETIIALHKLAKSSSNVSLEKFTFNSIEQQIDDFLDANTFKKIAENFKSFYITNKLCQYVINNNLIESLVFIQQNFLSSDANFMINFFEINGFEATELSFVSSFSRECLPTLKFICQFCPNITKLTFHYGCWNKEGVKETSHFDLQLLLITECLSFKSLQKLILYDFEQDSIDYSNTLFSDRPNLIIKQKNNY